MTWMPTWEHFSEVKLGTRVESWVEQKARPQLSTQVSWFFSHQIIKIRLHWIWTIFECFSWGLKVGTLPSRWDLLTWVGLGTWDPMWIGLRIHKDSQQKLDYTLVTKSSNKKLCICKKNRSKMTLNYQVIVERYSFPNEVVGGLIPTVKSSLD